MAPGSRIIAQLIVNGLTVLSRAFITAYNEALKNARHGGAAGAANAAVRSMKRRMPSDEALKILSLDKSDLTAAQVQEVIKAGSSQGNAGNFQFSSGEDTLENYKGILSANGASEGSTGVLSIPGYSTALVCTP